MKRQRGRHQGWRSKEGSGGRWGHSWSKLQRKDSSSGGRQGALVVWVNGRLLSAQLLFLLHSSCCPGFCLPLWLRQNKQDMSDGKLFKYKNNWCPILVYNGGVLDIYGKGDMGLGFQNMLYILGPYVACTFRTEHLYCFHIEDTLSTLKPVLFFLLSNVDPNMFVVNVTAFVVSEHSLRNILIKNTNCKVN